LTLSEYIRVLAEDDLPRPIHEARIFADIMATLPVDIPPDTTLAGDVKGTWQSLSVPAGISDAIDSWCQSENDLDQPHTPTPAELLASEFNCFGGYTPTHTTIDYARVIDVGFNGILQHIARERDWADVHERSILEAMEISLNAVAEWAERYAVLASMQAEQANTPQERKRLELISESCRSVPIQPAQTFHQALQSIWFCHVATGISEYCTSSISLGRLDQYLFPLFLKSLSSGETEDDLEKSLSDLFRKLNGFGDAACAVNLGGVDQDGSDLYNPLSEMIIRTAKKLRLPSPILAAHVHSEIPDAVVNQLVDPTLFAIGQPTFYGESSCQEALVKRGVSKARVHQWAANSCMGLMMPGQEISDMWGSLVHMLLPLELATNQGKPYKGELPIPIARHSGDTWDNIDDLVRAVFSYTEEILDFCIQRNREATQQHGINRPNAFLSAMIKDCIERGLDRALGGARYHTVVVESFGLINVSDALVAIDDLVFRKKRYTLAQMVEAAKNGYVGYNELHEHILNAPKYGNGDDRADEMAIRMATGFAHMVDSYTDGNLCYMPSFHTLNAHVNAGAMYGASLDGRLPGEPIAKNVGTSPGRCKEGLTAMLLSAASLPQTLFFGGQALDISIDPSIIRAIEDKRKFMRLLQTYFALGGLQIQVNGIGPGILRDAMANPQAHTGLTVRIAGYSTYFVILGENIQLEMIERFSKGM
jgi:formate C-acetyltransferase